MDQKMWRYLRDHNKELLDFTHYNKTRKIQKSIQYNTDPSAKVIHHLRDTDEQRKYNDEHYELWGHNLDGTFEYGKYVIFVTEEWHSDYHKHSEETRKKISEHSAKSMLGKHLSDDTKEKLRSANLGKTLSDETKQKISEGNKGKIISEKTKQKISEANKGRIHSDESRKKMSDSLKKKVESGWNPNKGRKHSDETKEKYRLAKLGTHHTDEQKEAIKDRMSVILCLYKEYKSNGGTMTWNEFQKTNKLNKREINNE